MKKHEGLRFSAAKLPNSFKLRSSLFTFLALLMLGFSGCEMTNCVEEPEPINFCGTVPNPQNCNVMATAETVICGAGVWANIWLRLDDGTLLQPWENLTPGIQLVNGQRYRIGYELMARDNRHNNAVICQAVPPAAETARITCIEEDILTTTTGQ